MNIVHIPVQLAQMMLLRKQVLQTRFPSEFPERYLEAWQLKKNKWVLQERKRETFHQAL